MKLLAVKSLVGVLKTVIITLNELLNIALIIPHSKGSYSKKQNLDLMLAVSRAAVAFSAWYLGWLLGV